jgi:3'-phosphoadenosine 5'-phosphosulfate (PAPS) 3'-phosphatase
VALSTDNEARVSGGFFPFFRYHPDMREELARIEAAFFARLETHEGANLRDIYDDQYISNAGQLVLLAQSKYRMIADLRAHIAAARGRPSITSKPYDVAAAIPIARAAGAIVTSPMGDELDFELNATTPISFVAWANVETEARLAPHLTECL